jgi:hypothetical protein
MANTIKLVNQSVGLKEVTVYFTGVVDSGPTQFSNTVVYNSATVLGLLQPAYLNEFLTDPLTSSLLHVFATVSSKSSGATNTIPVLTLNWDATTPVVALPIPINTNPTDSDFRCFGGLKNQGAAGRTGNITLTSTGLLAGDVVTLVLTVLRD